MDKELLKYESNEELSEYFVREYSKTSTPIAISFRDLFPEMNRSDRYTHLIHSYPAKLLVHIPYFFLNNSFFSQKEILYLTHFVVLGLCCWRLILLEEMQ